MKNTILGALLVAVASVAAQTPQLVLPKGHSDIVNAVAVSPACASDPAGGRFLLTGSSDNTAKLWDRTGHEILTCTGHKFQVNAVAFSPDGQRLLTGSSDGTAKIWDLSGRIIHSLAFHQNFVTTAVFSPDGRFVLTGSKDGTAALWDAGGGDTVRLYRPQQPVTAVAFSPDGKIVLTACEDGSVTAWDRETGSFRKKYLKGQSGRVNAVAFLPDGASFVAAYKEKVAKIWSVEGDRFIALSHVTEVSAVAVSSGGHIIATGDIFGFIYRWNEKGERVSILQAHPFEIRSLAFSPAGTLDPEGGAFLLSGSADNTARLWDRTNKLIRALSSHTNSVTALSFATAPNEHAEKFLNTWLVNGLRQSWNLSSNDMHTWGKYTTPVACMALSPDGVHALVGDENNNVHLLDQSGKLLRTYSANAALQAVAFSPDGQLALGATAQKTVFVWDTTGQLRFTFATPMDIGALAMSASREFIATGSPDGGVRIWDSTGVQVSQTAIELSSEEVLSVAFSPLASKNDVPLLIYGDSKGQVFVWNANADKVLTQIKAVDGSVRAVGFSADGQMAASGHADGVVKLWALPDGQEKAALVALDSADWVVASPSGLFDASPDAMNLMYYVQDLRVIELEQLKRYWEPGLLAQILQGKPLRNVSEFGALDLPPEIEAVVQDGVLKVKLREPKHSGGLGRLSLLVNGKEVAEHINPDKKTELAIDLDQYNAYFLDTNKITLRAFIAGDGWLRGQDYNLTYVLPVSAKGQGSNESLSSLRSASARPHLYVIAIGTSKYNNPKMRLRYPDQDAEVMAKAFQAAGSSFFQDRVHIQLLSTAENRTLADKQNIRAAFESVIGQAKAPDILVVYFSGHGLTYGPVDNSQFYYLTKDVWDADALVEDAQRNSYAVSSVEITAWLKAVKAQKQVLIFDACNSGSFANAFESNSAKDLNPSDIRAYDEMKDVTGTYILAGAAADKVSFEASQFGQGLLTYSLLEGMSGLALPPDRRVDIMRLFQYADRRVETLARDIDKVQKPMLAFPKGNNGSSGESFVIGKVDAAAQTNMPAIKPVKIVFIKSRFVNIDPGGEDLDLDQALADYLEAQTALDAQAAFMYIPVDKYAPGYRIIGHYKIDGDQVKVSAAVRKGDFVKTLSVVGKKDDLHDLASRIFDTIAGLLQ